MRSVPLLGGSCRVCFYYSAGVTFLIVTNTCLAYYLFPALPRNLHHLRNAVLLYTSAWRCKSAASTWPFLISLAIHTLPAGIHSIQYRKLPLDYLPAGVPLHTPGQAAPIPPNPPFEGQAMSRSMLYDDN